jgi:hypothetical protein
MMTDAADLLPLVLYHPSLAPMENRCDYFGRMYGYVRYVLQPKHEVAYEFILGNVIFLDDWDAQAKSIGGSKTQASRAEALVVGQLIRLYDVGV